MTVTRDDVALRAGVSSAVVSYVLNGGPRAVSADKRARVLAAIADLGYHRDAVATALSSRRSLTLGLLLPDASSPFFADLARRIEDLAFARGYTVLIGNAAEDRTREARHLEAFRAHRVDGVIACLSDAAQELPAELASFGDRAVLVDRVPAGWPGRSVSVDSWAGGQLAAGRLVALGRRRIGVITGPRGFAHVEARVGGFRAKLPADVSVVELLTANFDYSEGRSAMQRMLSDGSFDAVFCCTDALAIGALSALSAHGARVPADVAVIGYDDVAHAAVSQPPLTTVAQPLAELAARAIELILDSSAAVPDVPLTPRLVIRESA